MKYELIKTGEKGYFEIYTPNGRFGNDCSLSYEYERAMGKCGYVGHIPGGYVWKVFLETVNPNEMNLSKWFHYKKEAIEFLNNL